MPIYDFNAQIYEGDEEEHFHATGKLHTMPTFQVEAENEEEVREKAADKLFDWVVCERHIPGAFSYIFNLADRLLGQYTTDEYLDQLPTAHGGRYRQPGQPVVETP